MRMPYRCGGGCGNSYNPLFGACTKCGKHPCLGEDCDHDCDSCGSVLFPPMGPEDSVVSYEQRGGYWKRVFEKLENK
jgi:hypothetical protein